MSSYLNAFSMFNRFMFQLFNYLIKVDEKILCII